MSVHLVLTMHVHCQLDGVDPNEAPTEAALERLRGYSLAYENLLEEVVPEGIEVMAACVTSIQSAPDPDLAGEDDFLERLKCALVDTLRSRAL